jgi:hypothetical protein
MTQRIFLITTFLVSSLAGLAQKADSVSHRSNLIKLNFSTRMLYPVAYVLSYERVLNPHRSFSITGGYLELFRSSNFASVNTVGGKTASGFTVGADYRFYPQKENKFNAPHGLYFGPYIGYYSFSNTWFLTAPISGNSGSLESQVGIGNLGFQVGYQYILNDRWAFDMVFLGPSISNYYFSLDLKGNFSVDEENQIGNAIIGQFPILGDLIDGKTISTHGKTSSWAPGYRFTVQIGYKFGKK